MTRDPTLRLVGSNFEFAGKPRDKQGLSRPKKKSSKERVSGKVELRIKNFFTLGNATRSCFRFSALLYCLPLFTAIRGIHSLAALKDALCHSLWSHSSRASFEAGERKGEKRRQIT